MSLWLYSRFQVLQTPKTSGKICRDTVWEAMIGERATYLRCGGLNGIQVFSMPAQLKVRFRRGRLLEYVEHIPASVYLIGLELRIISVHSFVRGVRPWLVTSNSDLLSGDD